MVDFDLRELSAPLEALRPEVKKAYKRLDDKWDEVANQLKSLPIPCAVGCLISENPHDPTQYTRLEWRKWRGKKRLCITFYCQEIDPYFGPEEHQEVTPYEQWSAEQRVKMLQHVPELFECAVEQVKQFIDKTRNEEDERE